jgi:hypothetical protein
VETRATRRPGQKGTRKHLEQYGDRLLFVRYRYDPKTNTRLTTVELIVDARPARPASAEAVPARTGTQKANPAYSSASETRPARPLAAGLAAIRIGAREQTLRDKVRAAGGYWDPRRGLWILRADRVHPLGLESRLVPQGPADPAT